jgi:hypothetical protein
VTGVGVYFDDTSYAVVQAALARLIPTGADPVTMPGATEAGLVDYIDRTLGAFTFDPPRIWAGGALSGRHGGEPGFDHWVPLSPLDELAWRMRIEGSKGRPEREFNGPVRGWQEIYADGIAAIGGAAFLDLDGAEQDARLQAAEEFTDRLYQHAVEGMYGDPVYGGNRDFVGWQSIAVVGDVHPRGYTDDEVERPQETPYGATT